MRKKCISFREAAALIPDGAVVTVSSSSALGCPDAMLKAIGERYEQEGNPRNITTLHPIAAGDMYGIKGIDHIAKEGLLLKIIAGSYPSGPSHMESPAIWKMIDEDRVEAYNVPSGILFDMHRDVAAHRAGVFTKVGLGTFVDPRNQGCKMNAKTKQNIVELVTLDGSEWLHFPNIPPTVAIIRGTTADERGNISMEHEGAYLGVLDQALAARNSGGIVIAQVKRLCREFSIPTQRVFVPSTLVDYIVVDPDQRQTTETVYDPAISGEIRSVEVMENVEALPLSVDTIIARRAAMELKDGMIVNLGFGISALVPRILREQNKSDYVTWAIEQGAVGGIPLTGFAFGCAVNAEAIMPSPYQFTFFQGGGIDLTLLSFMQVGGDGSVNVSRLRSKPHVTAGCGGFVDIVHSVRNIVFCGTFTAGGLKTSIVDGALQILQDGKSMKFTKELEHITFSGTEGIRKGQNVMYVTERCVIALKPAGLTVVEIAPGIDLYKHILEKSEIPLLVDEHLKPMDPELFTQEGVAGGCRG